MANVEIWKQVVGFEGFYEVSDMGRIRSLDRIDGMGRAIKGKILRGSMAGPQRRSYFLLSKNGVKHSEYLSRIVLQAFVGPSDAGMYCCHGNGDFNDNRLVNLRWASPAENSADMKAHGTANYLRGEDHPRTKLSADDVRKMRRIHAQGRGVMEISRLYGMDRKYVSGILSGKNRTDVPQEAA